MESNAELVHLCPLLEKREIISGWYLFELQAPQLARAGPGQFVQVRVSDSTDPLLRRPVSIHYADPERGMIRLLIRIAGRGTLLTARIETGQELDVIGPLGRGFPFLEEKKPILLVGGGIGMAPLYFAAVQRRRAGLPFELLLGTDCGAHLPPDEYFSAQGIRPFVVSEDGSRGGCGLVTELLKERLALVRGLSRIHACGPEAMLARVAEIAHSADVPTHLSLESRMACGVGACLGCVVPLCIAGKIEYRRVCRDGPVFDGGEVYFDS